DASAVRGATRCTQREADQAVARGEVLEAMPEVGSALGSGEISGAHVDLLARTAKRTSVDAVASGELLEVARAKPADAMRQQVTDFVRTHSRDADLAARRQRQLADRRAVFVQDDMGVLHAEFDDTTFAQVKAAVDAEADRLFRSDGGRDGAAEVRTPQQRRADALASLILDGRGSSGPPAVRNQMIVVVQDDGSGHIPGVGPLPKAEIERLACGSDLIGLVLSQDGQPLWLGSAVRLASDDQWRALIVRDGGCIGCGVEPSRCEAHHVHWVRDGGPTDIDNLVLVCSHHHHLIHDKGWRVLRGGDGRWTLAPP
ncbi:MAG: HNH endonuclease, partial [Actinomycetota bacterium]